MIQKKSLLFPFLLAAAGTGCNHEERTDLENIDLGFKPNILWISCEDISPYLPMYGDSTVRTPNLERLAAEGIVFENAFAPTGQCAPTRHSIITGMHSTSTSGSNMRTGGKQFPDSIHCFPEYLEEAGYYCTNNSKTDYNFSDPPHKSIWNESSKQAHWKNRPGNIPFFAVFNLGVTHESQLLRKTPMVVSPEDVPVPPYYPDTGFVRNDIARVYNNIIELDSLIGQHLDELEDAGLMDSTVIIFWSDHGGPLPKQKREVQESGIHVPMMVRLPGKKYAGTRVKTPVSLMDLGPTALSLAGIQIPANMQGKAFMGAYKSPDREYVFGGYDRKGGTVDISRYVRSKDYLYLVNYYPELPHWARTPYRLEKIPMMKDLLRMHNEGQLNEVQDRWFSDTKAPEELYYIPEDPHCIHNLAENPEFDAILNTLRKEHIRWFLETRDVGLFPEPLQADMEKKYGMTMYEIMRVKDIPLDRIRETVLLWMQGNVAMDSLVKGLNDPCAAIRYHAAVGIGNLAEAGDKAIAALEKNLNDEYPTVRIAAAYALLQLGYTENALPVFEKHLEEGPADHETGCLALSLIKRLENGRSLFLDNLLEKQAQIRGTESEGQYFSQELDNVILLLKTLCDG